VWWILEGGFLWLCRFGFWGGGGGGGGFGGFLRGCWVVVGGVGGCGGVLGGGSGWGVIGP